jgi:hypothetical protein
MPMRGQNETRAPTLTQWLDTRFLYPKPHCAVGGDVCGMECVASTEIITSWSPYLANRCGCTFRNMKPNGRTKGLLRDGQVTLRQSHG